MFIRYEKGSFGVQLYISREQNDWNAHRVYRPYGPEPRVEITLLTTYERASIADIERHVSEIAFVLEQARLLQREME